MSLVEYHDPDNLFPLLAPGLSTHLPLRNLHWKSPSRPLRSIASLHVGFVSNQETRQDLGQITGSGPAEQDDDSKFASQRPSRESAPRGKSLELPAKAPYKSRRHQIPGLRHTPFLKIYLLRCDDSEAYKTLSRKLVREWIKENSLPSERPSSKTKQDNHDAFEWLVLHVVFPDTPAAGQPRWSRVPGGDVGEPKEKTSSAAKWPGRSSTTILEKIRADFNQSGKSAPDRVAQIRLRKDTVPSELLPTTGFGVGSGYVESPSEHALAWNDMINKLKTLILTSFDLRVAQYEEDIREKDSQRNLPGWNFCTFFVLKEGLARAFESVGLIEDALVGYDELSAGLDTVIRDQASSSGEDTGSNFQGFTEDLQDQLGPGVTSSDKRKNRPRFSVTGSDNLADALADTPLTAIKKDYRSMILSNNISIFDFQCYVFSRQMALLLRLANVRRLKESASDKRTVSALDLRTKSSSRDEPSSPEDITSLAQLCKRAPSFVTSTARIMRQDLKTSASTMKIDDVERVIDLLVSSWAYSVAQQILDETSSTSLQFRDYEPPSTFLHNYTRPSKRPTLPARPHSFVPVATQVIYENERFSQSQDIPKDIQPTTKAALGEVAAHRADLLLLQRKILQSSANAFGWSLGQESQASGGTRNSKDGGVTNGTSSTIKIDAKPPPPLQPFIKDRQLALYLSSFETCKEGYQYLTSQAIQHYLLAGQKHFSNTLIADLAVIKYEEGDFASSAALFNDVAPMFSEERWNSAEYSLLKKFAHCLKELHRRDEYFRVGLVLLAKLAAKERSHMSQKALALPGNSANWMNDAEFDDDNYFSDLIEYSKKRSHDMTVPMEKFFEDIHIEPFMENLEDQDGFRLGVTFRPLIGTARDKSDVEAFKVRIVEAANNEKGEIWLQNKTILQLRTTKMQVWATSNVTTFGEYIVDKIILRAGKLVFVHDIAAISDGKNPLTLTASSAMALRRTKRVPKLLVYPCEKALDVNIAVSEHVHIGKTKNLVVRFESGWNDVERGVLQLRSGSAGLRIHTAGAEVFDGDIEIEDVSKAGTISFGPFPKFSTSKISIPYDLERSFAEISVRVDFSYITARGQFTFHKTIDINVELAVEVNVQDIFKEHTLISKFFIRPGHAGPCHVLDAHLDDSDVFDVQSIGSSFSPMFAVARQPACVPYRIRRQDSESEPKKADLSLPLTVSFRSVQEMVLSQVTGEFLKQLKMSRLANLERLLVPWVRDQLQRQIQCKDYEVVVLTQRLSVPSFEAFEWGSLLEELRDELRQELELWLRQWHEKNPSFMLQAPANDLQIIPSVHRLTIDFEVPQVTYLHTASLLPKFFLDKEVRRPAIIGVGRELDMELRIKHTRQWDYSRKSNKNSRKETYDARQAFSYEIHANPETWLIAGQRRGRFTALEDEDLVFKKVMVPLRTGHVLLPTVDVKLAEGHLTFGTSNGTAPGNKPPNCETDCTSQSETVLIIGDSCSVTVGFGQEGQIASDMRVLESKARA